MKKAFVRKKRGDFFYWRLGGALALFALIIAFAVAGTRALARAGREEELSIMEQAVRRSVVQCYAIEGRYPKSVDYLAEHYGLMVNREKYIYHYERVADNLMPEVFVFPAE